MTVGYGRLRAETEHCCRIQKITVGYGRLRAVTEDYEQVRKSKDNGTLWSATGIYGQLPKTAGGYGRLRVTSEIYVDIGRLLTATEDYRQLQTATEDLRPLVVFCNLTWTSVVFRLHGKVPSFRRMVITS